jgi:hypothetical protein
MWNDDALRSSDTGWTGVVKLNTNVDVLYWTDDANSKKNTVNTYLDAGHSVYNYWDEYNYYALGTPDYPGTEAQTIYEEWSPYVFDTSGEPIDSNSDVKGSAYCIWADNPAAVPDEDDVMAHALPRIRANGAKAWDADTAVPYATYAANKAKTGDAPEGTAGAEIWVIPNVTNLELAIAEYEDLDKSIYTPESYAACTKAAEKARELLKGRPSQEEVDAAEEALMDALCHVEYIPVADTAALEAAVAEFENVNPKPYTEESFADYRAAVNAGKALLEGKPSQEEVDDAVTAIENAFAALERRPAADTAALEAAIAEFEDMDPELYTEESFRMYAAAVEAAQELLLDTPYQEEVDAALALIQKRKDALRRKETVGSVECFISGDFRSATVNAKKTAILQISVFKNLDIVGFEIYNDLNNEITITSAIRSTVKLDRYNWTVQFKPTKAEKGDRTYTIYAILADGSRSADCLTLALKVK